MSMRRAVRAKSGDDLPALGDESSPSASDRPITRVSSEDKDRTALPKGKVPAGVRAFLALLGVVFLLALTNNGGEVRGMGTAALEALGVAASPRHRKERVALLTVATHLTRPADSADSESEYGASKVAYSYPLSVDNKARYAARHNYDLNVDVHTEDLGMEEAAAAGAAEGAHGGGGGDGGDAAAGWGGARRSSRFRKLQLILSLWESYDWLIWMDMDAVFLDPTTDVLSLLDQSADLHFTLEPAAAAAASGQSPEQQQQAQRVNTGFFAVRTTAFARAFFERAWAVNDCGRGASDQRSINYVLGTVNADDAACDAAEAALEWARLLAQHPETPGSHRRHAPPPPPSHHPHGGGVSGSGGSGSGGGGPSGGPSGGHSDRRVRYYKKAVLNAFPADVSRSLVPVDHYALPDRPGDEQGVSVVVHFAGQYGGARSSDGKMPLGMLVQYLHLLSRYHLTFLERLEGAEAKARLEEHGDASAFHHYHDGPPAAAAAAAASRSPALRGRHHHHAEPPPSHGPKTVQEAVATHAGEWTRPLGEAAARVRALDALLEHDCLAKIRDHYGQELSGVTGRTHFVPPVLPRPPPYAGAAAWAAALDERGHARVDPALACDYVQTLSAARQHLATLLPRDYDDDDGDGDGGDGGDGGGDGGGRHGDDGGNGDGGNRHTGGLAMYAGGGDGGFRAHTRWPRSLLCAAPMGVRDTAKRLGDTRQWLELRKASSLAKLQFGAPFSDEDDFQLGGLGSAFGGGGSGSGSGSGGHPGRAALPVGPSLYAALAVGAATAGRGHGAAEGGGEEAAYTPQLLVAVAECAFLDYAQGTVLEATYAYSADPEPAPGPRPSTYARPAAAASGPPAVHALPGAVFLPPMSRRAADAIARVSRGATSAAATGAGAGDPFNGLYGHVGGGGGGGEAAAAAAALEAWTYTLPLLCLLLKELPAHVSVVLPPPPTSAPSAAAAHAWHAAAVEAALPLLGLPRARVLCAPPRAAYPRAAAAAASAFSSPPPLSPASSLPRLPAGGVVYADALLSLHPAPLALPLASVALAELARLRHAAVQTLGASGSGSGSGGASGGDAGNADPVDDLVILLEEAPLDASTSGGSTGTRVADWFGVEQALREALPGERVVRYAHGLAPDDPAALEFFRRAKLLVVASGVVPSLVMALYASPGTPVLDLVGPASLAAWNKWHDPAGAAHAAEEEEEEDAAAAAAAPPMRHPDAPGGDDDAAAAAVGSHGDGHEGSHEGWAWTRHVCAGLGLRRFPVRGVRGGGGHGGGHGGGGGGFAAAEYEAAASPFSSGAVPAATFDPTKIGDAARRALYGSGHEGGAGGADDNWREGGDDRAGWRDDGAEEEEAEGGGEEEPSGDDDAKRTTAEMDDPHRPGSPGGDALSSLSQETRDLLSDTAARLGFGRIQVEAGLRDRDRLGELLQRLPRGSGSQHVGGEAGPAANGGWLDGWRGGWGGGGDGEGGSGNDGGVVVGAERGDFALQLLEGWPDCPSLRLVDSFEAEEGGRKAAVTEVLSRFSGKLELDERPTSAARRLPDDAGLGLVYLDPRDKSAPSLARALEDWWPKLRSGGGGGGSSPPGVLAGHDFTRAHGGVAEAVVAFAHARGLTLHLTEVMRPRAEAGGGGGAASMLPPCCPSWYLVKEGGGAEAAVRAVAREMNNEEGRV